jgi:hypothetical protein
VLQVVAATLPGDFNGNGTVDADDYNTWRAHFGQTLSFGSGVGVIVNAAVPEPAVLMQIIVVATVAPPLRRRATLPTKNSLTRGTR